MKCAYENDKACSNVKCPMWANYCPVSDKPGICKFENRGDKVKDKKVNFIGIFGICIILLFIIAIVVMFYCIHKNNTEYEIRKYSLVELYDEVYGTISQVSSPKPAYNYEMVTLCCEGNVYTFNGSVEIIYTDSVQPYVQIHDYNIINADKIWVYVPSGSIEFQKGIGVG